MAKSDRGARAPWHAECTSRRMGKGSRVSKDSARSGWGAVTQGGRMSLGRHLEQATARLEEAAFRIDELRKKPPSLESQREWLIALTEYCTAASDVQRFANESVHEKLHAIAGRLGVSDVL